MQQPQQPQQPQDQARSQAQAAEATNGPRYYAANIKRMLGDVQTHVCNGPRRVGDQQARALFETTAEVLGD
jgi:hypothetical protein